MVCHRFFRLCSLLFIFPFLFFRLNIFSSPSFLWIFYFFKYAFGPLHCIFHLLYLSVLFLLLLPFCKYNIFLCLFMYSFSSINIFKNIVLTSLSSKFDICASSGMFSVSLFILMAYTFLFLCMPFDCWKWTCESYSVKTLEIKFYSSFSKTCHFSCYYNMSLCQKLALDES